MKVLWFTNIPMPDVNAHFRKNSLGTGGWMGGLLDCLREVSGFQLGVVTACTHFPELQKQMHGVDYFIINQNNSRLTRTLFPADNNPIYLKKCVEIIKSYKPDIVHVHGTERFYGELISKQLVDCPVVISIQGIMDACSEWYRWFGKMSFTEVFNTNIFDSLKLSGLLWQLREARRQAARERKVLQTGSYFFGRTDWDRAYVSLYNERAKYFHVNRVIGRPFWQHSWQREHCQDYRIIFTNTRHPRKGTELLIDAISRLKKSYPDIKLILIGSLGNGGYANWLKDKIKRLGKSVEILGKLSATDVAQELLKAHLFVSASYIDNSPNSVAEAQLMGMPVISAYTGGVPSMIKDKHNGLLFPTGDVALLVNCIKSVFENDSMAEELGRNAATTARQRHDSKAIVEAQMAAYKCILSDAKEVSS